MGKIISGSFFLCKLMLLCFSLSACSVIKIVTVKNDTTQVLQFRGQFISNANEIDNLDFILNPGDVNSWRYEIGRWEKNVIDKGLKKIILSNTKGCIVELEGDMITDLAKNKGMWRIDIDKNIMDCN